MNSPKENPQLRGSLITRLRLRASACRLRFTRNVSEVYQKHTPDTQQVRSDAPQVVRRLSQNIKKAITIYKEWITVLPLTATTCMFNAWDKLVPASAHLGMQGKWGR